MSSKDWKLDAQFMIRRSFARGLILPISYLRKGMEPALPCHAGFEANGGS